MPEENKYGMVYHIDMELIRRAREQALRLERERLDEQMRLAKQSLEAAKEARFALDRIHEALLRMKDIAAQAANDPGADLQRLNREMDEYKKEINRIAAGYSGMEELNKLLEDFLLAINPDTNPQ